MDEVRPQQLGRAGLMDVGHTPDEFVVHHADFHAGQARAQAVVRAPGAERQVLVRCTGHIERHRIDEHLLVPVGCAVPDRDFVAFFDLFAVHLDIALRGAAELHHGSAPTEEFLHGIQGGASAFRESSPLIRILEQRKHGVGQQIAGCLIAGHGQQKEEQVELHVAQRLAVDFGSQKRAYDVIAGCLATFDRDLVGVHEQFGCCVRGILGRRRVFRVVAPDHAVRPLEQLDPVFLRNAHHLRNHLKRQLHRNVGDKVA